MTGMRSNRRTLVLWASLYAHNGFLRGGILTSIRGDVRSKRRNLLKGGMLSSFWSITIAAWETERTREINCMENKPLDMQS